MARSIQSFFQIARLRRKHRLAGATLQRSYVVILCVLLAAFLLWTPFIAPMLTKKDNSFSATVNSTESDYNDTSGVYSGLDSFTTTMAYSWVASNNDSVELKGTFVAKDTTGVEVWNSQHDYNVNVKTAQHDATYKASRDGYLFGQPNSRTDSYTYWHPKYDIATKANFIEEETLHGVKTYKFTAGYSANVTQQYIKSAAYAGDKDIVAAGSISIWVEPITGNLVNYVDTEQVYYYDRATGKELSPWKQITDSFDTATVVALAKKAESYKGTVVFANVVVPSVVTILLAFTAAALAGNFVKKHKGFGLDSISAAMLTAVAVFSAVVLIGWLTVDITYMSDEYWVIVMRPWEVAVILGLTIITVVLNYANRLRKLGKIATGAAIIGLFAVFVAQIFTPLMPGVLPLGAFCAAMLCAALFIALCNRRNVFLAVTYKVLLGLVFAIGIVSELMIPFKAYAVNVIPQMPLLATPTALLLALLAIAIYHCCYSNAESSKRITEMPMRVAIAVACMAVLVTGSLWRVSQDAATISNQRAFEEDTNDVTNLIDRQLNMHVFALVSGVSLFNASEVVTRSEWTTFFNSLRPTQNLPGIQGIGFAPSLSSLQRKAYEQSQRAQGMIGYTVYPETTTNQTITPVQYVDPEIKNITAFGFDMYSSPERRVAMERARDTGEAAMSSKVTLVIEPSQPESQQPGFQMYVPLYAKGTRFDTLQHRQEGLVGYVFGPVRMYDFMNATVGDSASDIGVSVYDTTDKNNTNQQNKMYESDPNVNLDASQYKRTILFTSAGHTWTIKYGSLANFNPGGTFTYTIYLLVGGLGASGLLGLATYSLLSARQRAQRLAQNMTQDLRNERNKALDLQREDDAIFASMGEGMVLIDKNYLVHRVNVCALKMLGYAQHEFLNRPCADVMQLFNEKTSQAVNVKSGDVGDLFSKNGAGIYERVLVRKDGGRIPVRLVLSPVVVGRSMVGFVVIIGDITKQRQLDQAKDVFLSLATHQLKTPATAIKWYNEMLIGEKGAKDELAPNKLRIARAIDKCVKHMMYIVDNLLDVSRMETGRLKVEPGPVDVKRMLVQIINDFRPQIHLKKQAITFTCQEDLDAVCVDRQLVIQAISNILNNAIKYSQNGSRIDVAVLQDAHFVTVKIADQGYGIPKSQQPEVFKKFFRAENAVRREASGNGLGLYLVKAIVKANGGKVSFVSVEDKGSTFTVSLPRQGNRCKKDSARLT